MSLLRLCADLRSTLNSLIPNSGVSYLNSSPSALSDRLHPVCSRVTTDNLPTYTTAHNSPFFPLFSRFFFHHRPHLPYFSVLRPFLLHQAPFPFLIREPPPRLRSTQSQNQNADGPSYILRSISPRPLSHRVVIQPSSHKHVLRPITPRPSRSGSLCHPSSAHRPRTRSTDVAQARRIKSACLVLSTSPYYPPALASPLVFWIPHSRSGETRFTPRNRLLPDSFLDGNRSSPGVPAFRRGR